MPLYFFPGIGLVLAVLGISTLTRTPKNKEVTNEALLSCISIRGNHKLLMQEKYTTDNTNQQLHIQSK